jgi:hypothetical protein
MSEKTIKYLKIQIALKKITKEEVLAKYPELQGKL